MWLSIIDLEKLSNDPNAPKDERDVAIRTLKKLIMHFHLHPRKSSYPEKVNIAERVKERLDKTLKDPTRNPEENEVLKMLAEQSKGALGGFDDLMNSLFSAAVIRDMESHAIVDRLIEQRYFPGREYKAGGMTVLSGALAGTHIFRSLEGSKFNFQVTGGSLELDVRYDGNHLIVNGEDFGQLGTNDIVDFRERHLVYVNNIERKPTGPMTTQDSDQPSASAIESKPE